MSVLDVLDATNLCSQWSGPQAWALESPEPPRRALPIEVVPFSWWSLARNPQALLLSGVIAAGLVRDQTWRWRDSMRTNNP